MKKSKKKIILIAIFILLLSIIAIIGKESFSKYLTQVEGRGIIEVAGWSFLVNGQSSNFTSINLGQTINNGTVINNKMMPGATGSFDIVINAEGSDVPINYMIDFENQVNKPQYIEFTYDIYTTNNIENLEEYLTGTIEADDQNKVRTFTITWEWPYESGDDTQDTSDGRTLGEYSFDIIAVGSQVNSNE